MLFGEVSSEVSENGFSLFGMSVSDSINLIIAAMAILGFITSFIISILVLKQNRKLYKTQNDITLFNERLSLHRYFINFFNNEYYNKKPPKDVDEFLYNSFKMKSIFPKSKRAAAVLLMLASHYKRNIPFPELPPKYKIKDKKLSKLRPIDKEGTLEWKRSLIMLFIMDSFKDLDSSLFIFNK